MINHRGNYNLFNCNGIHFNLEFTAVWESFRGTKVPWAAAAILGGEQDGLYLGISQQQGLGLIRNLSSADRNS